MRGIDSVMKIAADRELTGVHGPLLEVFTCEPKVFTAVEVTAGNRQVLVASQATVKDMYTSIIMKPLFCLYWYPGMFHCVLCVS